MLSEMTENISKKQDQFKEKTFIKPENKHINMQEKDLKLI